MDQKHFFNGEDRNNIFILYADKFPFDWNKFPQAFFPIVGLYARDSNFNVRDCSSTGVSNLSIKTFYRGRAGTLYLRYNYGLDHRLIVATVEFIAIVTAPSGSTVNLRTKASAGSALIERVPIGSRVMVLNDQGTWTKVKYGSRTGYMMTVYLSPEIDEDEDLEPVGTVEERLTRLEKRVAALEDERTVG